MANGTITADEIKQRMKQTLSNILHGWQVTDFALNPHTKEYTVLIGCKEIIVTMEEVHNYEQYQKLDAT